MPRGGGGRERAFPPSPAARLLLFTALLLFSSVAAVGVAGGESAPALATPRLGPERVVFVTAYGDLEFGFYPGKQNGVRIILRSDLSEPPDWRGVMSIGGLLNRPVGPMLAH